MRCNFLFVLQMQKGGWVYILTNPHHTVLYIGVTSNLIARMQDHRNKLYQRSFTARYNLGKLVYYHLYDTIHEAIAEEKRLKGGSRKLKEDLIAIQNPIWEDLWEKEIGKW